MQNQKERIPNVKGDVTFRYKDRETNELLYVEEEHNLFVDLGYSALFRAFTTENSEDYVVKKFVFGSDYEDPGATGNFDIFNPQDAQPGTDNTTQTDVFEITRPDLVVNYPSFDQVDFSTTLDGQVILDMFPGNVDVRYNSLGLYILNGDPVAYVRFPIKSINALVSVDVLWEISFLSA